MKVGQTAQRHKDVCHDRGLCDSDGGPLGGRIVTSLAS